MDVSREFNRIWLWHPFQYYLNVNAPMGYYLKFGLNNYFYKVSADYAGYDSVVVISSEYYDTKEYRYFSKPGTYSANKWEWGSISR